MSENIAKKSAKKSAHKSARKSASEVAKPRTRYSVKKRTTKPKTRQRLSHKTITRISPPTATSGMSMTDLQFMAKSRGVPFGGLKKSQLVRRINAV